jgi:site-specific DNA recombinase
VSSIAPLPSPRLRAAFYLRVSPENLRQQEEDSLDRQEALCRAHCAANDWEVVAVFKEGHTGAELFERVALRDARDLARRQGYDVLVVKCVDRFGREPVHQFIVIYELKQAGVRVEFVQDQIPDTAEGQIIHHVLAYGAKKERERILERTYTARKERATKYGMPLATGKAPFGYEWADARKSNIAPVEPQATHARRIWDLAEQGRPLRNIGMQLAKEGIPTPSGKLGNWSLGTLRDILHNPAYMGRYEALRWRRIKHERILRPAEERVPIPCPALVSPQTFEAVQHRLSQNKQGAARNNRRVEDYLLRAGYIRCAVCGCRMTATYTTNRQGEFPIYVCASMPGITTQSCPNRTRISAHKADTAVRDYISALFQDESRIRCELERLMGEDPTKQDLAAVEQAAKRLAREEANLTSALAQLSAAAQAPVIARLNQLAEQRAELSTERERVLARRGAWEAALERLERIDAWRVQIANKLDGATYERWREILFACGVEVRVHPPSAPQRIEIKAEIDLDPQPASPPAPSADHIVNDHTRSATTLRGSW